MVTPQQEKGFRLLEKLIRSKYPWIVKLHIPDPDTYVYQMTINFDINLKRLVDQYDLQDSLKERFRDNQSDLDHFINYSCWSYLYSIVIGSIINSDVDNPDKMGGYFGNNINQEIERYSTLIYSKLPPDMVVNIFNGDMAMVYEKAPHMFRSMMDSGDRSYLSTVKTLSLGCYTVIPESSRDLLGGV